MQVRLREHLKPSRVGWAFGVLLAATALLAFLLLDATRSFAKSVFQQLTVPNAAPAVTEVVVSLTPNGPALTELVPTESGQTTLYVRGTVTDPNGCGDLQNIRLSVHRADLADDCVADPRHCLQQPSMVLTACAPGQSSASFQETMLLPYFADPTDAGSQYEGTDWVASVSVSDDGGLSASLRSQGFEVDSLVSLMASSFLDFGTVTLGKLSQPKPIYLVNDGNRDALPDVTANRDMTCDGPGSRAIPASAMRIMTLAKTNEAVALDGSGTTADEYLRLSLMSDGARQALWSQGLALSLTDFQTLGEVIPAATGEVTSPYEMYLLLQMPSAGVRGSCSTDLRVTAMAR